MSWVPLAPTPTANLVDEIDRVTAPYPGNIMAPTSAALLLAAKDVIVAGDTNPSLADDLRIRAVAGGRTFADLYLKVADAITP